MDAKDIILPVAAVTTIVTTSGAGAYATGKYDSTLNQTATWGDSCVKTDLGGNVMTYSATGNNVEKVIVKGGTENAVYTTAPFTNLTAPINPNSGKPYAISHVIVCASGDTTPAPSSGGGATTTPVTPTKPTNTTGGGEQTSTKPTPHVKGETTTKPQAAKPVTVSDGKGGTVDVVTAGVATSLPTTGAGSVLVTTAGVGAATYAASRVIRKRQHS